MIVNKLGKYKFIKDYISRNSIEVSNIKVGDIMRDWVPWELPVVVIEEI